MADTFDCSCGERLVIPPAYTGHKLFCLHCRRAIRIPGRAAPAPAAQHAGEAPAVRPAPAAAAPRKDAHATAEIAAPLHSERISASDGTQFWKLTCPCGKRLLAPANSPQPYGHCPKCGRRLPLPGFHLEAAAETPAPAPAGSATDASQDELRDDHATTVIAAARVQEGLINRTAASTAAARLRPSHSSREPRGRATSSGRISAWPLAGKTRRLLAAFIDFSLAGLLAAAAVALAGRHVQALFSPVQLLLGTLLLLLLFNDTVVHLLLGGSIGKHLVVLAIRTEDGVACGFFRLLVRTVLKWVFIPGWLIGALDPAERAAHDLLAGTLVLKGRPRHK